MSESPTHPVIFGEVLFDEYADGSRHIGGAPFNVAWHLQAFGQSPLFISRIGQHADGELVLMSMAQWGMSGMGVQIDREHSTGRVHIIANNSEVLYKINDDQAYDYISSVLSSSIVRDRPTSLIYCGTLALRHEKSRKTYNSLCVENSLPRFVDLNLRAPWWDAEHVSRLLQGANWVKVNEDELKTLVKRDILSDTDLRMAADIFRRTYAIEVLFITRAEKGACLCANEVWLNRKSSGPGNIVDPVGAGDAFSAACILGIQLGWSHSQVLQRATQFSEKICALRGATSKDKSLYSTLLAEWQK